MWVILPIHTILRYAQISRFTPVPLANSRPTSTPLVQTHNSVPWLSVFRAITKVASLSYGTKVRIWTSIGVLQHPNSQRRLPSSGQHFTVTVNTRSWRSIPATASPLHTIYTCRVDLEISLDIAHGWILSNYPSTILLRACFRCLVSWWRVSLRVADMHSTIETHSVPCWQTLGGLLGIWCSHAYAHSHSQSIHNLPSSLKGVDMAMYEIFRALGLQVTVRPILDERTRDYFDDSEDDRVPGRPT